MMKMNRKALALLASVMLAASTAGCGNPAENNESTLEAMASVPGTSTETGTGEEPSETPASSNEEPAVTTEPTEKPADTAAPTEEPAAKTEKPAAATAEPTAVPAAEPTAEPTAAPAAETPAPTEVPAATAAPEPTAEPVSAPPILVENAPAVAGLVTSTETVTVTTPAANQRPEGMPETVYSEDEMYLAMLLYGRPGDGYKDNGDGTWSYFNGYADNAADIATETVTTTVTTDNWYKGTTEDVLAKLAELEAMYPDGSHWGEDSVYDNPGSTIDNYISNDNACAGWVKLVSDYCFGYDAPCRKVTVPFSEVRPGDIVMTMNHAGIYISGDWHENDEGLSSPGRKILMYSGTAGNGTVGSADGLITGVLSWGKVNHVTKSDTVTIITRWPE